MKTYAVSGALRSRGTLQRDGPLGARGTKEVDRSLLGASPARGSRNWLVSAINERRSDSVSGRSFLKKIGHQYGFKTERAPLVRCSKIKRNGKQLPKVGRRE